MNQRSTGVLFATLISVTLLGAQPALASGYLDPSFGQNGTIAIHDQHSSYCNGSSEPRCHYAVLTATAFGKNGRIWAAAADGDAPIARSSQTSAYYVELYAFTSTGKPDATFHQGKPLVVSSDPYPFELAGPLYALKLLTRSDGGVFVVSTFGPSMGGGSGVEVTSVSAIGAFNSAYGNNGTASYTYGNDTELKAAGFSDAVLLSTGAIRICGARQDGPEYNNPSMLLVGFTPTGQPDAAVGADGTREIPQPWVCGDLVSDPSGNLLAAGITWSGYRVSVVVTRITPNGVVDTTYGVDGIGTLAGSTRSIALRGSAVLDPNGGLIVGLSTRDPGQRSMAATGRFNPDGTVDTSYGYGGIYRYVPTNGSSALTSLDATRSGKVLISLTYATSTGTHYLLDRILDTTGRVDPTFGHNGTVAVTIVGTQTLTDSVGRIVAGGFLPNRTVSYIQRRSG